MRLSKLILILIATFIVGQNVLAAGENVTGKEFKIIVPVSLIAEAGFSQAVAQLPVGTKFTGPNLYFRVKEKADAFNGWGDVDNIVSVLVQRTADDSFVFNKGQEQVINLGGRFQYNTGTAGYYISVTGPDLQKVSTLAKKIKVLY